MIAPDTTVFPLQHTPYKTVWGIWVWYGNRGRRGEEGDPKNVAFR